MNQRQISELMSELGKRGGAARAKKLSAKRRKEIANESFASCCKEAVQK
jgi:hypothetical protein